MDAELSLAAEVRRGFNAYNLTVGAATALAAAIAVFVFLPDISGEGRVAQALTTGLVLFALITALHTGGHAYFGWRFGRGVRAARAGDHELAILLLRPLDRRGMDHYDPASIGRDALAMSRNAVART